MSDNAISLIRYAGTHIKTERYAPGMCHIFRPAAQRGWRTCIVLSGPPQRDEWLDPFRALGTRVEYLPRPRGNFDLSCVRAARDLCRRLDCRVFHCDNMHTSPMLGAAWAGVPVRVWSKRSMQPAFEECRTPRLRDRLALSVRTTYALATRVLPVSSAVAAELCSLGLSNQKITVFPNACDRPAPVQSDRSELRYSLGFDDSHVVLATVGHAVPVKGWDLLLDAFRRISTACPALRMLLIGSVSAASERQHHAQLLDFAARAGIADRVRFTGFVPDVYSILSAADFFVLPSRSEGDSNALLQALMGGMPCVATRVGSAGDLIEDGVNGLLVERDDSLALAKALHRMADDPILRARIAANATAQSHAPSSAEYGERLVALYETLLAERGIFSSAIEPPPVSSAMHAGSRG